MSFIVNIVTDKEELTEVYRLRYKVYCIEWGFEDPDKHPDGIESDEFDRYAVHFAVRDDRKTIGAIRLILHSTEGFPAERYCQLDMDKDGPPRESIAEISRLAISKDFRRRKEDNYIYGPDEERRIIGSFGYRQNYSSSKFYYRRDGDRYKTRQSAPRSGEYYDDRRKRHELVAALYKAVYQESKRRQLTHWYAVMTKGLVILLKRFGFRFQAVGDPVDYHGIRTPYMGDISRIEQEVSESNPTLYDEFTRGL